MIDMDGVLLRFLTGQPSLLGLVGERIYPGAQLPTGTDVSSLPALLVARRGGGQDYSSHVFDSSYQILAYGKTEDEASNVARTLYDVLNDKQARGIIMARMEGLPQPLRDPESGWPLELCYYRVTFSN